VTRSLPPAASAEDRVEKLFGELKEARALFTLADEVFLKAEKELEETKARHEAAKEQREEAMRELTEKKAEFDRAFEASAA
jgi:hypothetical protein